MEAFGDFVHGTFFDGLALDQDHVFVAIAEGLIVRFSLHGDPPVTLFKGQATPAIVALDDTCVYWTNTGPDPGAGSVMRGPKSG
jgi:hypothetical protein